MLLPISPVDRPVCLTGQLNGRLDPELLVETVGQAAGPVVRLVEPAARAWRALAAAARDSGHVLKTTSLVDSYRPYAVQERTFLDRYTTTPNGSTPKHWRGQNWYLKPGYASAAVPGTSNHGWALAVDIGEEKDGDAGTESIDDPTVAWLVEHAAEFGFSAEIQSEPWHWRYVAGDDIPDAVLAYENKELDMAQIVYWSDEPSKWWLTDLLRRRAVADGYRVREDLTKSGIKVVVLDPKRASDSGWTKDQYLTAYAGPVDAELGGALAAEQVAIVAAAAKAGAAEGVDEQAIAEAVADEQAARLKD